MKRATVIMPVVGEVMVFVEVHDDATDRDAINAAFDLAEFGVTNTDNCEPLEFEVLDEVTRGNVNMFSASNTASVEWEE